MGADSPRPEGISEKGTGISYETSNPYVACSSDSSEAGGAAERGKEKGRLNWTVWALEGGTLQNDPPNTGGLLPPRGHLLQAGERGTHLRQLLPGTDATAVCVCVFFWGAAGLF